MTHRIRWHKPTDSCVPIFSIKTLVTSHLFVWQAYQIFPGVYLRSPILIGDNKREYLSHKPWIHGTYLLRAPHVWCCFTDFSSLTALLDYLVTNKIKTQSLSPDGKYQIIFDFVKTFHKPLDDVYFTFDRCVVARLCQQTRFIMPVESVGADRVLIVPEDSGSHRHREYSRNRLP